MPLNEKYPRFDKQMITYVLSLLNNDNEDFIGMGIKSETFYEMEGVIVNKTHTLLLCPRSEGSFYGDFETSKPGKSIFNIELIRYAFDILEELSQKDYIEIITEPEKFSPAIIRKGMFEIHIPPIDLNKKAGGKQKFQSHILNGEDLKLFPLEELNEEKTKDKQEE